MTTFTRPQLLEELAIAETNYRIARRENETAWKQYDNVVEWRLAEMATQDAVEHAGSLAEATDEFVSECYDKVNALKAALLERAEIAAAPLPVDDGMSIHFVNGEVDYIEPGALIDNETDELPY